QTTWGIPRERARYLLASVFGSHTLEPRVLTIAVGILAVTAVAIWCAHRGERCGAEPARRALALVAVAAVVAALLCPQVLMNTWGLWERIPPIAFVVLVAAVPWPSSPRIRGALCAALAAVALFASGTAVAQGRAFSGEVAGIREIAQQVPRGARVRWSPRGEEQP